MILKKARYQIDNRINARQADWDILFPRMNKADIEDWMNTLSVIKPATLVASFHRNYSFSLSLIRVGRKIFHLQIEQEITFPISVPEMTRVFTLLNFTGIISSSSLYEK